MKERFKRLPYALQKQILLRFGVGLLFLLVSILVLAFYRDIYFFLPCFVFAIFFGINGVLLFKQADKGKYVVVEGICSDIERTPIRKRVKSIYMQTDADAVKLIVKQRVRQIAVGNTIRVYVADNTPVYEQEQCKLLCTYLCIEIVRGVERNDSQELTGNIEGNQTVDSEEYR